jgi:Ca2+-binding RTX toxin-like protein
VPDGIPDEWVDRTVLPVNTTDNIICASVTSLSPFAVFRPENLPPTADVPSGPSQGVRGQTLSFTGSFTDPDEFDSHMTAWDVFDSDGGIVATGSGATFSFIPTVTDTYTVAFTVTDDDGASGTASTGVTVGIVLVTPDPLDPTQRVLWVGGSTGRDKIDLKQGDEPDTIEIKINEKTNKFKLRDEFGPMIDRIVVYGQAGDDDIKIHNSVGPVPAELYGGEGNDKLRGGQGDDVIVGGGGDDTLAGKDGRDLLIGGLAKDKMVGDDHDDILIGGVYIGERSRLALMTVMSEWTRLDLVYSDRVSNISLGTGLNGSFVLNETTVFDDSAKDHLAGKKGLDWFLGDSDDDKIGVDTDEILTEILIDFLTEAEIDFLTID